MYKNRIILTRFFYLLIALLTSIEAFAQSYFQQEVNYKIHVTLNDKIHELFAEETIEYINNSPDTLKFIYFHLWPNAYKNHQTAFAKQCMESGDMKFQYATKDMLGYIDELDFKINNEKVKWALDEKNIDVCKIILNRPLLPKEKINISTPFHVKIPSNFSRMGHEGNSYQLTQWYPKPTVYDKDGWHPMPYLDQGEFYSEFGNFDVSITLPRNYIVAATGNLQNEDERNWLKKCADETAKIQNFKNIKSIKISSDTIQKTLHFTQDSVHDFAWFADKNFLVLNGKVKMPTSQNIVETWAFFEPASGELWKHATDYIRDALVYYSQWIGEYPYKNCSAVLTPLGTGGGMEYPTITAIDYCHDTTSLEQVIMHEVGHNWFYGILGSDERDHPWMDEGINSFYEMRYTYTKYPHKNLLNELSLNTNSSVLKSLSKYPPYYLNYLLYLYMARQHQDQHSNLTSTEYTQMNYGIIVYYKTAYLFNYLLNYLDVDEFDKIMKIYFEKWKFKHPQADDLKQIFTENCKADLNWFFDDLIKTTKKIDYKILSIKKGFDPLSFTGDCWDLTICNKGDIVAPFPISSVLNDSIISTKWMDGFSGTKTIKVHFIDFDKLVIDANFFMPDFQRKNNTIKKKGVFKKVEPIHFKFLVGIENADKTEFYYLPVAGWNNYNKTMLGVLLYNNLLPARNFEYQLMPMYSYVKNDFAGTGKLNYTMYPKSGVFHNINISLSAMQYAWEHDSGNNFQRYKGEADFKIRANIKSPIEIHFICNSIAATDIFYKENDIDFYENFIFTYNRKKVTDQIGLNFATQVGKDFTKCSINADYKFLFTKNKAISFHLFAGKFIYNNTYKANLNFRLSGTSGLDDYTYSDVFLGRTESIQSDTNNVFAHQFVKNDGAFVVWSPFQSKDWLVSLNMTTALPIPLPIKFYAGIATFPKINMFDLQHFYTWETGIELRIIPDIFSIFLPLFYADDIKQTNDMYTSRYVQKIRFTLNLNKLNIFEIKKNRTDLSFVM